MLLSGDVSRPAGESPIPEATALGNVSNVSNGASGDLARDQASHPIDLAFVERTQPESYTEAAMREVVDMNTRVSVADAYTYCRKVAQQIARTFYYGSLFLPVIKRRATWALYAFCRTADDIADEVDLYPEPVAELAKWRNALLDTYAGKPRGPILTAWADTLNYFPVPIEPALDLLRGVEMDIAGTRYMTFDDLRLYCYRVAGTVGLLMLPVLGSASEAAAECAVNLGIAMQLTNILRDIGEDAAIGRIYLPDEDLGRFGYSREQLMHGIINDAFLRLIEFEIARAEEYYERGMRGIQYLAPESQLAIALSGTLYRGILSRIRGNQYDVFSQRAHISLPGKMAALPGVWLRLHFARSAI